MHWALQCAPQVCWQDAVHSDWFPDDEHWPMHWLLQSVSQ